MQPLLPIPPQLSLLHLRLLPMQLLLLSLLLLHPLLVLLPLALPFLLLVSSPECFILTIHAALDAQVMRACDSIVADAVKGPEGGLPYVGCDMEWTVVYGQSPGKTATLQIATNSRTYIFHLSKLANKNRSSGESTLPQRLVALLQDNRLQKVGINIAADFTKLSTDYVEFTARGVIDASKIASQKCSKRPRHLPSLRKLCRALLQKDVAKPTHVIISDWDR